MFKYYNVDIQLYLQCIFEMDKQICQANTKKWVAVRPRWDGAPNAQVTVSESERKKIQPFGRSSAHPMETQQTLHHPPRR